MIKLPIEKLQYSNPPSYKTIKSYRPYLREVSKYTCSYCGISEAECSGATFNIDHFRPQTLFPDFSTTCSNLRYSCPRCNSYKSDNWITKEQGCIRNCAQCSNKVCTQDIARFIDTLNEAIRKQKDVHGVILHSDQGFQYTSNEYKAICEANGIIISMSPKGSPVDNSPIESFHSSLKRETLKSYNITSLKEYVALVKDWILFYNTNRIRLN